MNNKIQIMVVLLFLIKDHFYSCFKANDQTFQQKIYEVVFCTIKTTNAGIGSYFKTMLNKNY